MSDRRNPWLRPRGKKSALVLGHRGAMGLAPENTLSGMRTAVAFRAALLEIDVHLSRDGRLVVMHDETVDRTTNGRGFIRDLFSREIRKLDAGIRFAGKFKNEKVPFLEDILDFIKGKEVRLNIELKNGPVFYPGIERKIAGLIGQYGYHDKVLVSSFDHQALLKIKKIDPSVSIAILYAHNMVGIEAYAQKLRVAAVHPHHYWVSRGLVRAMHRINIAVNTWVVNSTADFLRLSRMGVDAVGTNYPDRFKRFSS